MDLTKFKGADDTVRLTIRLSIGYCILLTAAFVSCIIYLTVKIEKAYSQALVIDKNGEVYETSSLPAGSMRKYEYLNHVKTFVTHWYAFDESTYEGNISLALNLIGNKGKELLNEYNDVNMLNSLIQKTSGTVSPSRTWKSIRIPFPYQERYCSPRPATGQEGAYRATLKPNLPFMTYREAKTMRTGQR